MGKTRTSTATIICNGPSLASVPNTWLDKYPTFGSNRLFLKYSPDVLALLDLKMVHNKKLQDEAVEGFKNVKEVFISPIAAEYIGEDRLADNVTVTKQWINVLDNDGNLTAAFSQDPRNLMVSGGTVTYGLMQLAYWKGYRNLLLVGCNHTFRDPRGDHFDERYNVDVAIPYHKENIEDFASEPGKWFWSEDGFIRKVDFFYNVAKTLFEREGGSIINCTPDTKCTIFPVDDWRNY